jgi:hypothetical protein
MNKFNFCDHYIPYLTKSLKNCIKYYISTLLVYFLVTFPYTPLYAIGQKHWNQRNDYSYSW